MRNLCVYFLTAFAIIGCGILEPTKNAPSSTKTPTLSYAHAAQIDLPDWILPELNRYPIKRFFFDVGKSDGTDEKSFEIAVAEAHKKAATRILRKIKYIIRHNKSELQHDLVREHYSAVLEHYRESRLVSAALQLKGFSVRNLSVDFARTDRKTYALVYIEREKLRQLYATHEEQLRHRIKQILKEAKTLERTYDIKGAIGKYLQTYPLYETLKEAEIVQIGAVYEHQLNFRDAFSKLVDAATDTGEDSEFLPHRNVIKRVEELERKTIVNFSDIVSAVNSQLSLQILTPSSSVSLEPLTYEDSEMICPFAREFSIALQQGLKWATVDRMRGLKPTSPDISRINQMKLPHLIPSCWENGDEITIRATLRNVNTGEFLASTVVRFWNSQLREPLVCKPRNYKRAQIEREAFAPQYYVTHRPSRSPETFPPKVTSTPQFSQIGGLKVEVSTEKGTGPLYYTEGETVTVFGRVNQEAYIRLLYILADGKRTLLLDNYHIDPSLIDRNMEIGEFVCVPPFGTELLIVAARTEPFPSIETYEENGYALLVDQDAGSAARSFRGLQQIPNKPNEQQPVGFQQSDTQLVLTIMEK